MEYNQYLQTKHWQETRSSKLEIKPYCQICTEIKLLQIHHKRYKNKEGQTILYKEKLTDLITLCASCHRLIHAYFGINVKKINKQICRIRRLTELGATKDKAFWLVSKPNLYKHIYTKMMKGGELIENCRLFTTNS